MKTNIKATLIVVFLIVVGGSLSAAESVPAANQTDLPTGSYQVTFVELGSVNCIPCKQMKPVMKAVEDEYAGKVRIVFHDVWADEGKTYGRQYGIRVIPTQVFIDKNGKEIFRHEGFFSKESIEKVLSDAGVQK